MTQQLIAAHIANHLPQLPLRLTQFKGGEFPLLRSQLMARFVEVSRSAAQRFDVPGTSGKGAFIAAFACKSAQVATQRVHAQASGSGKPEYGANTACHH